MGHCEFVHNFENKRFPFGKRAFPMNFLPFPTFSQAKKNQQVSKSMEGKKILGIWLSFLAAEWFFGLLEHSRDSFGRNAVFFWLLVDLSMFGFLRLGDFDHIVIFTFPSNFQIYRWGIVNKSHSCWDFQKLRLREENTGDFIGPLSTKAHLRGGRQAGGSDPSWSPRPGGWGAMHWDAPRVGANGGKSTNLGGTEIFRS